MIRAALLAAFLLLGASLPAAARPLPRPAPALFVARAPGITLYLFGSLHALPADTKWETPAIDAAFDGAQQAWFEAILSDMPLDIMEQSMREGLDHEHTLSDRLTEPERQRLRERVASLSPPLNFGMVNAMRPWLATLSLATASATKDGLDATKGVDLTLQARATTQHKPMIAIEDPAATLHALATLPDEAALGMLREALDKHDTHRIYAGLVRAWLAGDIEAIGRLFHEGSASDPAEAVLLGRRNQAWADRLAGLKGSNATIFLTVGAGHLAGPHNLRELLAERGFTLARLPTASPAKAP